MVPCKDVEAERERPYLGDTGYNMSARGVRSDALTAGFHVQLTKRYRGVYGKSPTGSRDAIKCPDQFYDIIFLVLFFNILSYKIAQTS